MDRYVRIQEDRRNVPRVRVQPLDGAQVQADIDAAIGALPDAENGIGAQGAVPAGINRFLPAVGTETDQAAFPGAQPKVPPAVAHNAVDHGNARRDRRKGPVIAVRAEQPGAVRSQVNGIRRLAERKDIVRADDIEMHQRQRAGRVAGKAQLEIAHPDDVVLVDVQGDQVVTGQGEKLVRVVRHLLPASVRPEQEEAVVARCNPHVAGGILRDGRDAVELAFVLR